MKAFLATTALLLAAAAASAAAAGLTDAQVRAFVAKQETAWNSGALPAYFAAYTPDAVFTDQYRTPAGQLVPYGKSTLAQARVQTRKSRAKSKVTERAEIVRIALSPDGRTADVTLRVSARIEGGQGAARTTCAERRQSLVLAAGAIRSRGQTDTFMRCRR